MSQEIYSRLLQALGSLEQSFDMLRNELIKEKKRFRKTISFVYELADAGEITLKYKVTTPFRITKITMITPPSATATASFDYAIYCLGSPVYAYPNEGKSLIRVYQGESVELFSYKNFQQDLEVECYMKSNFGATTRGKVLVEIEAI